MAICTVKSASDGWEEKLRKRIMPAAMDARN